MTTWVNVEGSPLVLSSGAKDKQEIRGTTRAETPQTVTASVQVSVYLWQSCMASAAAVPSSSREALATGMPVMSQIMVW